MIVNPSEETVDVSSTILADQVDMFELAMCLIERKWKILSFAFAFAFIALVVVLIKSNVYTANTEIIPPRTNATPSLMSMIGGGALTSLGSVASSLESKSAADTYAAMLSARPVLDDLVQRFHLRDVYHAKSEAAARKTLEDNTTVTTTKENFIVIAVSTKNPTLSMQITNAYVDALRTLMKGMALTQASQKRLFYEDQLNQTKENLAKAEVDFQQTQQANHVIALDVQAKATVERSSMLSAQIAAKEVQLQALRSYSTEANPQVQIVEKELATMRAEQGRINTDSQGTYSDLGLSAVPHAELSVVRATRELKFQEQLFEQLAKQYEISRIDEAQDAPVIQVIEPAIIPDRKSGPQRSLIVLGSFLLGGIIGCLWAFFNGWRASLPEEKRSRFADLRRATFSASSRRHA